MKILSSIMKILSSIWIFLSQKEFLISFFSGVFSGLVVSILIGIVVYQYTNIFKSPKLSFVVKQNGFYSDRVLLSQRKDGQYEAKFQFAIKNSGNQTIKAGEGYWHIYVQTDSSTPFSAPGEQNHNRDLIRYPVYANSFLDIDFVYNLVIKKEDIEKNKIPYFFQTDYGNFPERIKIDPRTGIVLTKDMAFIEFELPR